MCKAFAPSAIAPPRSGAEAVEQLDRWLKRLAVQFAPQARVSAWDFLHELRVRVFIKWHTYRPAAGAPTTWSKWQARRVMWDYVRERRQYHPPQVSQGEGLQAAFDGMQARHEPEAVDAGELAAVMEALAELPDLDRQAVRLLHGLDDGTPRPLREAGRVLGVSFETVRKRVDRGLGQIREQLPTLSATYSHD